MELKAPVSLLRASAIYTFAGSAASIAPLLLLPVLTRYLAPSSYGIVAIYMVLVNALVIFMGLGVNAAVNRRYFDRDRYHFPDYVVSALVVVGIGAVITGILVFATGGILADSVRYPVQWMPAVWATALGLSVIAIGQSVWQSSERPIIYSAVQLALAACLLLLTVLFVVGLGQDWQGRITAQVISVAVIAAVSLYLLFRGSKLKGARAKAEYVKDALRYCLPLVPHMLGGIVIGLADRVMLARFAGLADTGIYASGAQLAATLTILSSAINNAWIPWFYRNVGKRDRMNDIKIVRATYLIAGGYLAIAALLALLSEPIVTYMLGQAYAPSAAILPILAAAMAVDGIYKLMAGYFFYYEKLNVLYRITLSATVINIVSLYFGISWWGAVGAALAMLVTNIFFAVITGFVAVRMRRMPWAYWRIDKAIQC